MSWWKTLIQFWKENLERNIKRISIGLGSFIIVIITTCTLPSSEFLIAIYAAGVSFGTMVIMSIFGKNGNGQPLVEEENEVNEISESERVPNRTDNSN